MAKINRILSDEAEVVGINSVKQYHKNPRVGNVDAIRESLRQNGQFRPIIVQRSTKEIIGGNHTWKAAVAEGWTKIAAVFLDVTDEQAARIVLADNRTNDLATYNTDVLADILSGLPDVAGTGYDPDTVKDLLGSIKESNDEALQAIVRPPVELNPEPVDDHIQMPEPDNSVGGPDALPDGEQFPVEVKQPLTEKDMPDKFMEADETIPGGYGLKVEQVYELRGDFHFPPLRPEMLVQPDEVPKNLIAWAGSATKDWPDKDQWWLYNFGIDSTSGMHDISKMILSFYAWDHYFDNWWTFPDRYTAKMLNSGVKMAVMPDWSQWAAEPRVMSMFNLYRNLWMGRYFQEAGIKVIPNVSWRYRDQWYFDNVVRPAFPKKCPVISIQLNSFDKKTTQAEYDEFKTFLEHVGTSFSPDLTLFYVGDQGKDIVERVDFKWPGEFRVIRNRMHALAKQAKKKEKKTGL